MIFSPNRQNKELSFNRRTATFANLAYQYSSVLLTIVGIVMVPLYLRYIDLKLYGAWLASGDVIAWLSIFDPGLNELLRQQVSKFHGEKNLSMLGKSIGTGWAIMACLSVLVILFGFLVAQIVPQLFDIEGAQKNELRLSVFLASIGMALVFFSGSPGSVQQGLQKSSRFLAIYIVGWFAGITTIILLLINGVGLLSIPLGYIVRGLLWSVGNSFDTLYLVRKKLGVSIGWCSQYLTDVKGLIGAVFLKQMGRTLERCCDAFLVGIFMGVEVVPIVVFTSRLWQVAIEFGQRISVSFVPGLAHLFGEGKRQRIAQIATNVLRVTVWFVALEAASLIFLNKPFVSLWVGKKFFAGGLFNILMAFGVISYVYGYASGQLLFAANIIKGPALVEFGRSLLRLGLLVAFLNPLGIIAVPISIIGSSIIAVAAYLQNKIRQLLMIEAASLHITIILSVFIGIGVGLSAARLIEISSWSGLFVAGILTVLVSSSIIFIMDLHFRKLVVSTISKVWLRQRNKKCG